MPTDPATSPTGICPICRSRAEQAPEPMPDGLHLVLECPRCGPFEVTAKLQTALMRNPLSERQCANASGWVRSQPNVVLFPEDEEMLRDLRTPTVAERAEGLLRYLLHAYPTAGQAIRLDLADPAYLAITWSAQANEVHFVTWDFLGKEKGFLAPDPGRDRKSVV